MSRTMDDIRADRKQLMVWAREYKNEPDQRQAVVQLTRELKEEEKAMEAASA